MLAKCFSPFPPSSRFLQFVLNPKDIKHEYYGEERRGAKREAEKARLQLIAPPFIHTL